MEKKSGRMPFAESEEYVQELVARATERAFVSRDFRARSRRHLRWAAAAGVALLLAGAGAIHYYSMPMPNVSGQTADVLALHEDSPVEDFLDGLSDEDVQLLACYEMENIPEY